MWWQLVSSRYTSSMEQEDQFKNEEICGGNLYYLDIPAPWNKKISLKMRKYVVTTSIISTYQLHGTRRSVLK